MSKRVLYIVESFAGGVYTFIKELVNNIEGYEIYIAYGVREELPLNFRDEFNKNINFVKVKNFTREINVKKDWKAIFEVKNIINQLSPNIIHLHSSKAGVIGRLASKNKQIKMFYNPHGFSFLKQDDSVIKRRMYKMIEKFAVICNKKCKIVGCSKGEYFEAKLLNKNSTLINNGINTSLIQIELKKMNKKVIDYNELRICTVGRIEYQKNPKLFNKIAESFPKLKFTWIGDGKLKKELNSKNIQVTSWKKREDVLKLLNDNDVFILPSLWEGLPISLLEAMFMEKICIVSNVIGNKNVIKNRENGYIAYNFEDYVKIIREIVSNKDSDKMIKKAKEDVYSEYTMEKMISNYNKIYEN